MTDIKELPRQSVLAQRAIPMLAIGIVMVLIGVAISQSFGGVLVGLFNLTALVLVVLGVVGLVMKALRR